MARNGDPKRFYRGTFTQLGTATDAEKPQNGEPVLVQHGDARVPLIGDLSPDAYIALAQAGMVGGGDTTLLWNADAVNSVANAAPNADSEQLKVLSIQSHSNGTANKQRVVLGCPFLYSSLYADINASGQGYLTCAGFPFVRIVNLNFITTAFQLSRFWVRAPFMEQFTLRGTVTLSNTPPDSVLPGLPSEEIPTLTDDATEWMGASAPWFHFCSALKTVTLASLGMTAATIEAILATLPDRTNRTAGTIDISGNPGAATADTSVATARNWTVTTA